MAAQSAGKHDYDDHQRVIRYMAHCLASDGTLKGPEGNPWHWYHHGYPEMFEEEHDAAKNFKQAWEILHLLHWDRAICKSELIRELQRLKKGKKKAIDVMQDILWPLFWRAQNPLPWEELKKQDDPAKTAKFNCDGVPWPETLGEIWFGYLDGNVNEPVLMIKRREFSPGSTRYCGPGDYWMDFLSWSRMMEYRYQVCEDGLGGYRDDNWNDGAWQPNGLDDLYRKWIKADDLEPFRSGFE